MTTTRQKTDNDREIIQREIAGKQLPERESEEPVTALSGLILGSRPVELERRGRVESKPFLMIFPIAEIGCSVPK